MSDGVHGEAEEESRQLSFREPDGFEFMSRAAGAAMTGVLARLAPGDRAIQTPRRSRAFGPRSRRSGLQRSTW